MTLTTILTDHWVILAVGLGVSTLAFLVGRSMSRTREGPEVPEADLANLDLHSAKDRRLDGRRKGNPVEVDLFDPSGTLPPLVAYVADRSRGGLALLVEQELPIGLVLNARPRTGATGVSVPVEVRSTRRVKDGWVTGCQFQQMPPWNILLLFG